MAPNGKKKANRFKQWRVQCMILKKCQRSTHFNTSSAFRLSSMPNMDITKPRCPTLSDCIGKVANVVIAVGILFQLPSQARNKSFYLRYVPPSWLPAKQTTLRIIVAIYRTMVRLIPENTTRFVYTSKNEDTCSGENVLYHITFCVTKWFRCSELVYWICC